MSAIDLSQLSPEERANVLKQAKELEQQEKQQKQNDRETLKQLSEEFVVDLFPKLVNISGAIKDVKNSVFAAANNLLELKAQAYGVKTDQKSHSFTDKQGRTIKLGHRVVDRYDNTVNEGIALVREFVRSLATDAESGVLTETILNLLKMDKDGNLKPNRVLELNQLCVKLNSPEQLREGIDIILAAYKPEKTCQFVEVNYKDENGKMQTLPLSMSAID